MKRSPWWFALSGICVYALMVLIQPSDLTERMLVGRNDFVQLYSDGTLSGSTAIYSQSENQRIHREAGGFRSDAMARHSRPPSSHSC